MQRFVTLFFLILFAAVGGAAGWWFLTNDNRSEVAKRTAALEEQEGGLIKATRFIKLESIVFPIIREGRVILHLTLTVAVELDQPMEAIEVKKLIPVLRDAVFTELHGIYSLRYVQERGYDLPIVNDRLRQITERVLGSGIVKSVQIRGLSKRVPQTG
ncbi:MAG: hypothetical protein V3S40_07540 [Kiloniellales bacterium]